MTASDKSRQQAAWPEAEEWAADEGGKHKIEWGFVSTFICHLALVLFSLSLCRFESLSSTYSNE
jgi:hypothetical protein